MAGSVRTLVSDVLCTPSATASATEHSLGAPVADRLLTPEALDERMMLAHSPPVDVLVRTSGVCRLSDFMLWQVSGLLSAVLFPNLRSPSFPGQRADSSAFHKALLAALWTARASADRARLSTRRVAESIARLGCVILPTLCTHKRVSPLSMSSLHCT